MSDNSARLQARIKAALAAGQTLCVQGSGSYAGYCGGSAGQPLARAADSAAAPADVLQLSAHRGVVDYEPSEMVITVRAGTALTALQQTLAAEGQQLAVECPQLAPAATIGGAIAMGCSGSARPFRGALRDAVLGVRLLNGRGELLQFGGRVMKNVAGYDVSRLMVGSRGRLAVLLELSLRVIPLAEATLYLRLSFDALAAAVSFTNRLLHDAEPLSGASYSDGQLHLRFSARAATVQRLRRELGGTEENGDWWEKLRCWQFPWGGPGWRGYRRQRAAAPQTDRAWLSDWNGALVWSESRDDSAAVALAPTSSPAVTGGSLGELEKRLRRAFDPHGVFTPYPPSATVTTAAQGAGANSPAP